MRKTNKRKKLSSDSFIVRLLHHPDAAGDLLVGSVEDPQRGQQWSFRGLAELTTIFVGLVAQRRPYEGRSDVKRRRLD